MGEVDVEYKRYAEVQLSILEIRTVLMLVIHDGKFGDRATIQVGTLGIDGILRKMPVK